MLVGRLSVNKEKKIILCVVVVVYLFWSRSSADFTLGWFLEERERERERNMLLCPGMGNEGAGWMAGGYQQPAR